jgi:muramoyltetrapeptide carboxypeptidase
MSKIKCQPLIPGAKIGVIAPASPASSLEVIQEAVTRLHNLGYKTVLGETVRQIPGVLAGNDWLRRSDLERFWLDPSVNAIWCLRGGYGCLRLLPDLHFGLFSKSPKILIGFSDITALELGLWSQIKIVTFHGPVLTTLADNFSRDQAFLILSGRFVPYELPWPGESKAQKYFPIKPGKARGPILGGNLTTLVSLIGTKYLPSFKDTILFLEEVGEEAYRVDRMLTQLIQAGILDSVAAILVGQCLPIPGQSEANLIEVFTERLNLLKCPSGYGFPIGHIPEQWTIPQGILSEADTGKGALILMENPFID